MMNDRSVQPLTFGTFTMALDLPGLLQLLGQLRDLPVGRREVQEGLVRHLLLQK